MDDRAPKDRRTLPPSVLLCECLDGPFAGHVAHAGVRAAFVNVRDLFDASKPHERYRVEQIDGQNVLRWSPATAHPVDRAEPLLIHVRIFCTHCGGHSVTDQITGRRVDMIAKLVATDLVDLEHHLASLRCVECEGPMDVMVLNDG
ncbi:MAG: hypothetical protein ACREPM_01605 [Gemmatimonadaceae bacterium]